jgi:hypothetical protein
LDDGPDLDGVWRERERERERGWKGKEGVHCNMNKDLMNPHKEVDNKMPVGGVVAQPVDVSRRSRSLTGR